MDDLRKRKLRRTTMIYWFLLTYIIAALVWWFFSLYSQTKEIYQLKVKNLQNAYSIDHPVLKEQLSAYERERRRNNAKYIAEGITFLVLIIFGAVYIFRSVRRQFGIQQQQQNFVMAITHELKTPISVSRLNLETLQKHKLDEGKKEKLVQMTLQETLRLDNLINNILISSQLDGHSYQVAKDELNFSALVRDVSQQFIHRYPDRQLIAHITEDIDINGDALLLKLLLSNLLENANKYSGKGRPVYLVLQKEKNSIRLEVKDEGEGIRQEDRKHVFKKFYRIGNEQTRKTKGTGLGLYLCKKIAEDHKGQISIEDNHPQGTNFIVNFSV